MSSASRRARPTAPGPVGAAPEGSAPSDALPHAARDAAGGMAAPVDVARASLRATLVAFGGTQLRGAPGVQEIDRWVDEGGPLGRLYAGDRRVRGRERRAWEAHEFARDRVSRAVHAYAHVLHADQVSLPAALVAVRAAVAEGCGSFATAALATVHRDAAQCCADAFAAP